MGKHVQNNANFENEDEFLAKLAVPWSRSKDEVWEELSKNMSQQSPALAVKPNTAPKNKARLPLWKMSVAASLLIFAGIVLFMRTYSLSTAALAGQHTALNLPDGSVVWINAGSEISHHPYWWWAERSLRLTGEAFFKVKKGKRFVVYSEKGSTEVLGTSFNVYARGERYEVVCATGKVKVQATETQAALILHPQQKASLETSGQLQLKKGVNLSDTQAWMNSRLVFTSRPLSAVFAEIERQYKVKIHYSADEKLLFTGGFDRNSKAKEVLTMVCRPFGLRLTQKSENVFVVAQ